VRGCCEYVCGGVLAIGGADSFGEIVQFGATPNGFGEGGAWLASGLQFAAQCRAQLDHRRALGGFGVSSSSAGDA
jgi:hypothetical protein